MAIEAAEGIGSAVVEREAGAGVVDRLIELPGRLPGPTVVWFGVLYVLGLFAQLGPTWIAGEFQVELALPAVFVPLIFVYLLAFLYVLKVVAASAFREFEPALGPGDHGTLRRQLIVVPDRPALAVIGIVLLVVPLTALSDPTNVVPLPPVATVTAWVSWSLIAAAIAVGVLLVLRQLRAVSRLHAMATRIDIFDPRAINAFSRLTATSAIGILIVTLPFLSTDESGTSWFSLSLAGALIGVAVSSFVLPLRGMHERLKAEKGRLLGECNERLKLTIERVHGTVDRDDLARADELQKTLASLLAERDVLGRLPTWPWSPGTLRGFATAALLPVLLWVVIRALERFV